MLDIALLTANASQLRYILQVLKTNYFLGQKIWTQMPLLDSPQYPSPFYPLDLQVDIEGHEVDALPEWIESGALEKVV